MTDKPRNWQEDMNGCAGLPPTPWAWVSTEEAEWIEDSNQEIVIGSEDEYIFDDLLGPNVKKEAFMRFMINAPEALPYWLQEAEKWSREAFRKYPTPDAYEAACAALEKHRARAEQAESLIQQKDAEIAKLKKSVEGMQLIRKIEKSTRVQPEHTSFLQDKGDKL
ncbi:hypothetical protein ACYCSU_23915 [Paenibacillus sp. ALE1]